MEKESKDQQLNAKEQILEKTILKLRSTEEELRATNQQLLANIDKLTESEEKYRLLHENAALGVGYYTPEGVVISYNEVASRNMGGRPEDFAGKSIFDLFPKEDAEEYYNRIQKAIAVDEDIEYEDFIELPINNMWFLSTYTRIVNSKGEILGVQIISQEITKRKQAEIDFKESQGRYGGLVDTINSGVAVYKVINDGKSGSDYIIQDFNRFSLQHENMKKEEVVGRSLKDIRPNIDDYGLIDVFRKVWTTGEPAFFPAKVYVDEKYSNYYENRVFKLPGNEIVAVYDDVTESKRAEEELNKAQERFDLAINATNDGIFDWDLITNEIYYSPNWKKMLGYEDHELPNDFSIWENLTEAEDVKRSWEMQNDLINKRRDRFEIEFKMKHKDGHWVDILSRASAIFDETGKAIRIVGTHIDITERKKAEDQLQKIEWLLSEKPHIENSVENYQPYGDLTELNEDRTILNSVGKDMLKDIVNDYLGLLETSAAVYEKNGDYAFGIFSSGWCKLLDRQSWELTGEKSAKEALESGKWLCHESCWTNASLTSIKTGKPSDIKCHGGINIYAHPIYAFNEVVGSINFGYGNPPDDMGTLTKISKKYDIPVEKLKDEAKTYNSRPSYIIDLAKKRLETSAKIIGTLVELNITRKQLQDSEDRFKALHNASFGGIAIHNKGMIIECNQGLSKVSGYSYEELIGADGVKLLVAEESHNTVMNNILSGYEKPYEVMALKKNGEKYPARLEARQIPYKGIDVRVVEFRDISESKKAEQELISAKEKAEESDRLKSAFLANMSHEIRTPMNSILGFSDLLKNPDFSEEKRNRFIDIIQSGGKRLVNTINDIIDVSKIESGDVDLKISSVNVSQQIINVCDTLILEAEKKGSQIVFDNKKDKDLIITTDLDKLFRVLLNLANNAIKFTTNGIVNIGYRIIPDYVEFYVRDSGIGIPNNKQKLIFDRFGQADTDSISEYEGSGLGLTISKEYVTLMGGSIWVESELGRGSVFYFTIPYKLNNGLRDISNDTIFEEHHTSEEILKNSCILIVEDDITSKEYLELLLKGKCRKLLFATNGLEAVEICKANNDIDIILMDIKLPIMNGFEATKKIREFNKEIVIIAQTAYAFAEDKIISREAGCNDHISKPITKETLFELMGKWLT